MLEKLIELLGKDNAQKLEDGLVDIILDQVKDDFSGYTEYILSPEDVIDFADRCKAKAFKNIETELVASMEKK